MLTFLYGYEPLDWLSSYPSATPSDDASSYLDRFEGGTVLIVNWREVYKSDAFSRISSDQRSALLEMVQSGRARKLSHFGKQPSGLFFWLARLPVVVGALPDDLRREYFSSDAEHRGTDLYIIE